MTHREKEKPVFGIIGGIGAGKSTVARAFGDLGCAIIDADALAHAVLDQPSQRAAIIELLGPQVCAPDGRIDRSKVAERVFAAPERLADLTRIVHPPVLTEVERLLAKYQADAKIPAVVLDMPLLLEVDWAKRCDCVLFVDCDVETRKKRLALKPRGKAADRIAREKVQISLDTKMRHADNTIDNNSDVSALISQVTEIFTRKVINR